MRKWVAESLEFVRQAVDRIKNGSMMLSRQRKGTSRRTRDAVAKVVRFPRKWWRDYSDWRWVVTVVTIAAFIAVVLLPSGVALALRGGTMQPTIQSWLTSHDEETTIEVYRMQTGRVIAMPLGDYLIDVLAAQLPPNSSQASLQAAAIAARTYAVRSILLARQFQGLSTGDTAGQPGTNSVGSSAAVSSTAVPSVGTLTKPSFAMQHGADVTDNGALDLPMQTEATQEDRWGENADANRALYQQAIHATDGQVLTYKGQLILAFTFEVSPGKTRSAKTVFGKDIPYLQSTPCPDDELVAAQPVKTFTADEVVQALNISAGNARSAVANGSAGSTSAASGSAASILSSFKVVSRDSEGFVTSVAGPGGMSWSGSAFQNALGLPSANFTLKVDGGKLVVSTQGIGLDVGLSLNEAIAMGKRGATVSDILQKYYPGTGIVDDGLPG